MHKIQYPICTEKFEDTKGIIRSCKSKDRRYNGKTKTFKRANNKLQTTHRKLNIEQHDLLRSQ